MVFTHFAKCHSLYDSSSHLSEKEIEDLGKTRFCVKIILSCILYSNDYIFTEKAIEDFVHYYRSTFPSATFLPKRHMMEDHIVAWIQ